MILELFLQSLDLVVFFLEVLLKFLLNLFTQEVTHLVIVIFE